jgi:hypothetical protein
MRLGQWALHDACTAKPLSTEVLSALNEDAESPTAQGGIAPAVLQVMARLNEILNQELERRSHLVRNSVIQSISLHHNGMRHSMHTSKRSCYT